MACPTCAPRYCAPNRCYCGHKECDSYATFVKTTTVKPREQRGDAVLPAPAGAPASVPADAIAGVSGGE